VNLDQVYALPTIVRPVTAMAETATSPTYIDVNDPREMARWAKEFGISQEQLEAIIKIVGNSVSAIQGELATE
jgi:Mg2+ and Co2+ transporter CorA